MSIDAKTGAVLAEIYGPDEMPWWAADLKEEEGILVVPFEELPLEVQERLDALAAE